MAVGAGLICITSIFLGAQYNTFQLEFAKQGYDDQRQEILVTRRFNPFCYQLGMALYRDDLIDRSADYEIDQGMIFAFGTSQIWNLLRSSEGRTLLSEKRCTLLDIELENPLTSPQLMMEDYIFDKAKLSSVGIEALVSILVGDDDWHNRHNAAERLAEAGIASPRIADVLIMALDDDDERVQVQAASALVRLRLEIEIVIERSLKQLSNTDSGTRCRAATFLADLQLSDPRAVTSLIALTKDTDADVRVSAAAALGKLGIAESPVVTSLKSLLADNEPEVVVNAVKSLVALAQSDAAVTKSLVTLAKDHDAPWYQLDAAIMLGEVKIDEETIVAALIDLLASENSRTRCEAIVSLGKVGNADSRVIEKLFASLNDPENIVRYNAVKALGRLGATNQRITVAMVKLLVDKEEHLGVRNNAAEFLGLVEDPDVHVISALIAALADESTTVRFKAQESLVQLGSKAAVVLALKERLRGDDAYTRCLSAHALIRLGKGDAEIRRILSALVVNADSDHEMLRKPLTIESRVSKMTVHEQAARALVELSHKAPEVVNEFVTILKRSDIAVQVVALQSLGEIGQCSNEVRKLLLERIRADEPRIRSAAAKTIGRIAGTDAEVVNELVLRLTDKDEEVRAAAASALGQIETRDIDTVDSLLPLLRDTSVEVRNAAADSLGKLGQRVSKWTDQRMLEDLVDRDSGIRERAGLVLAYRDFNIKSDTVDAVREFRRDLRPWVRQAAIYALFQIENRKHDLQPRKKNTPFQSRQ